MVGVHARRWCLVAVGCVAMLAGGLVLGRLPSQGSAELNVVDGLACEEWSMKRRECEKELVAAYRDSTASAVTQFSMYTLYDQCLLFSERHAKLRAASESSCSTFAAMTVALSKDGWSFRDSEDLCSAFVRRAQTDQATRLLLAELPTTVSTQPLGMVRELCLADVRVRGEVAECMSIAPGVRRSGAFARCRVRVGLDAASSPDSDVVDRAFKRVQERE